MLLGTDMDPDFYVLFFYVVLLYMRFWEKHEMKFNSKQKIQFDIINPLSISRLCLPKFGNKKEHGNYILIFSKKLVIELLLL